MSDTKPKRIMDEGALKRTLERIALEILERSGGSEGLALVGVVRKGDILAARLKEIIDRVDGGDILLGHLDITLYRDDLSLSGPQPTVRTSDIPFDVTGRTLILVDDVLYTGRTTRAALDALMDFGRPKAIQFVALVDRGCRELPIQPDFVGLKVDAVKSERVMVELVEDGKADGVILMEAESGWIPGEE